jgi:hypothetical protein
MKKLLLGVSILCLASFAGTSQAQTITSVQLYNYSSAVNNYGVGYLPQNLTAGATGYDVHNWNSILTTPRAGVTLTAASSSLMDSTGAPTAYGFSVSYDRGDNTGNSGVNLPNTPYYYQSPTTSAPSTYLPGDGNLAGSGVTDSSGLSLTLSGLNTTHTYNILEYVSGLFYASGTDAWSDGATTFYVNPTNGTGLSSWVQGTATTSAAATAANFVEFTGVTSNTGSLTLTGTGNAVAIMGFQIVDLGSAPVPEPSTWAMMLGGLGMLAFVVRRKANLAK